MRLVVLMGMLSLLLIACAPANERYCADYVDPNDESFARCIGHFDAQQTAFTADKDTCETLADLTYPTPREADSFTPVIGLARKGSTSVTPIESSRVLIAPWDRPNTTKRTHIVNLCMYKMGWNSSLAWQAGRHPLNFGHRNLKKLHITVVKKNTHATAKKSPAKTL